MHTCFSLCPMILLKNSLWRLYQSGLVLATQTFLFLWDGVLTLPLLSLGPAIFGMGFCLSHSSPSATWGWLHLQHCLLRPSMHSFPRIPTLSVLLLIGQNSVIWPQLQEEKPGKVSSHLVACAPWNKSRDPLVRKSCRMNNIELGTSKNHCRDCCFMPSTKWPLFWIKICFSSVWWFQSSYLEMILE